MWNPKEDTNEFICKTDLETDSDLENELMATRGKRKREEETGSLGLTCTHCYIN